MQAAFGISDFGFSTLRSNVLPLSSLRSDYVGEMQMGRQEGATQDGRISFVIRHWFFTILSMGSEASPGNWRSQIPSCTSLRHPFGNRPRHQLPPNESFCCLWGFL